jgi:hypothetical protein
LGSILSITHQAGHLTEDRSLANGIPSAISQRPGACCKAQNVSLPSEDLHLLVSRHWRRQKGTCLCYNKALISFAWDARTLAVQTGRQTPLLIVPPRPLATHFVNRHLKAKLEFIFHRQQLALCVGD